MHEEGLAGTPAELRQAFASRAVKGEVVVVIAPEKARAPAVDTAPSNR